MARAVPVTVRINNANDDLVRRLDQFDLRDMDDEDYRPKKKKIKNWNRRQKRAAWDDDEE